jgi:hypothetical protein
MASIQQQGAKNNSKLKWLEKNFIASFVLGLITNAFNFKNNLLSCSNIALKCNTKLMNVYNQGRVWNTVHYGRNGLAWISEVPTMVIGVDLSHGKCNYLCF